MAKYRLSLLAELDLEAIYDYTLENWGVDQFQKYSFLISESLDLLAVDPYTIGHKERDDVLKGCLFFKVEKHFIVYRETETGVDVARILHETMNFDRHVDESSYE